MGSQWAVLVIRLWRSTSGSGCLSCALLHPAATPRSASSINLTARRRQAPPVAAPTPLEPAPRVLLVVWSARRRHRDLPKAAAGDTVSPLPPAPIAAAAAAINMAGGVLFGPAAWDPVAITAQIVAIQCLYYLSLGTLYKMVVGERTGEHSVAARRLARRNKRSGSDTPHTRAPTPAVASTTPHPAGPYVPQLTLHQFFDWRWVSFGSFQGWMVCIACFVNALVAALYLRLIVSPASTQTAPPPPPGRGGAHRQPCRPRPPAPVRCLPCPTPAPPPCVLPSLQVQRAKKCLDFAGTILFLHLVAVSAYSGFPRHAAWWAGGGGGGGGGGRGGAAGGTDWPLMRGWWWQPSQVGARAGAICAMRNGGVALIACIGRQVAAEPAYSQH